ncbi:MAG TPA: hypothetical protein PKA83_11410 [Pirellulaceae bacterium]|nr:hypothetical protein [Pirellulaceae bacterium]
MTQYRSFFNTDPPEIVRIWRKQTDRVRIADSFSHVLFENMVLSKPYFDPAGFIVAMSGEKMLGFCHAGFAPTDDWTDLDFSQGVISLLMLDGDEPPEQRAEVGVELIRRAEAYLVEKGSRQIHVGSRFPDGPFYLGLFGGSRLPGVLPERQPEFLDLLNRMGYEQTARIRILHLRLQNFQAVGTRDEHLVGVVCAWRNRSNRIRDLCAKVGKSSGASHLLGYSTLVA